METPISECNRPQSVDRQYSPILILQVSQECSAVRIIGADSAVAKIPHQQGIAEFSEVRGRQSQDPRRVQTVPRNQAMTVAAVQLEYVDEAVVRAGLVVMLLLSCSAKVT